MTVTIPEKLMIKAYRGMIGVDLFATICFEDFADDMKKPVARIEILGQQLVKKGLATLTHDAAHGWTAFELTSEGWSYVRKQKGIANKPKGKGKMSLFNFSKTCSVEESGLGAFPVAPAEPQQHQSTTVLKAVPIATRARKRVKEVSSGDKKKQKVIPHLNLRCPDCGYYAKTTPEWMSKGRLKCPVDGKDLLTKIERGETRGRRF